jgi:EmrB/QacA subfamily drug resistance transporter
MMPQSEPAPRSAPKTKYGTARTALAQVVVMVGVFMVALDATIVILALPEMERSLHVSLSGVTWVVIGYLFMITLLATQVGRLGDIFGRARMYRAGFIIFIIGSALCALASNESSIIAFRALQGVGGALMTANSGAVIADTFPAERRGRAYGLNAVGWNVGAILGILLGGVIVTYLSWRWIFWINVPVGIVAFVLSLRVLQDKRERQGQPLDVPGMVTLGLGVFGVLWAFTKLAISPLSASVIGYLVGGVLLLGLFVVVERIRRAPMLDLSIFKFPTVTPTLLAAFFQSLANFAVLFLLIMYLQGARAYSPLDASLLLVPGYVVAGFAAPISGWLSDRLGPVWPATAGLTVQVVALLLCANLGMTTPIWVVAVAFAINGIGTEGFLPANQTAVMKAAPQSQFGVASGMLRTFSNIGMLFSFSVAILVAGRALPRKLAFAVFMGTTHLSPHLAGSFTDGLQAAFYAQIAFMAVAAVLSSTRAHRAWGQRSSPLSRSPLRRGSADRT